MRWTIAIGLLGLALARAEECSPSYVRAPRYPVLAFQARVSGRVRIEMGVRSDGSVGSVTQLDGDKIFRAASEIADRSWKFGQGEDRRCVATFVYHIMPAGTSLDDLTTRIEPPLLVEVRRETAEATVLIDPAPVPARRK